MQPATIPKTKFSDLQLLGGLKSTGLAVAGTTEEHRRLDDEPKCETQGCHL